jgi:hypothetical protein
VTEINSGEFSMTVLKEASIETIKKLPDSCSIDDIMYEINFIAQVLEGLKDAEAGRVITTEELLRRVEEWAK